jgi:prepilin-type N-terminal cleavage/methylation domain-containing protein
MPMPIPSHRKTGFTLIELLTVIAIIGILAAILIPTVGKVRESANFSINVTNVRQWTLANVLHMQDWRGFVPSRGANTITQTSFQDRTPFPDVGVLPWWNALPPYLKERPLWERGLSGQPRIGDKSVWVSPLAKDGATPAWAAFLCYGPPRVATPSDSSVRFVANVQQVRDPSRTVLFGETPHFTHALRSGTPYPFVNGITSPNSLGPYNRNGSASENGGLGGKAVLGFFDGSVRILTGNQIASHGVSVAAEQGDNPDGIIWRLTPN